MGMRERAEALGGSFRIDSEPGEGLAVRVSIPLTAAVLSREAGRAAEAGRP